MKARDTTRAMLDAWMCTDAGMNVAMGGLAERTMAFAEHYHAKMCKTAEEGAAPEFVNAMEVIRDPVVCGSQTYRGSQIIWPDQSKVILAEFDRRAALLAGQADRIAELETNLTVWKGYVTALCDGYVNLDELDRLVEFKAAKDEEIDERERGSK